MTMHIPAHKFERKEADSAELLKEIKSAADQTATAFEEFKKANDARLKELEKKGSADVVLEEKISKISDALDKEVEAKTALEKRLDTEKTEREALELRLSRPGNGKAGEEAEKELKSFNDTMRSVNGARGRGFTDLDQKGYEAYAQGFKSWLRHGEDGEHFDKKTMQVGSDPDGGYFVTPDLSGRMVMKVYETSEMRQIASIQAIGTDALEGIEDTGEAGAGYAGEQAVGSDTTTPQVGKWRIPVFWIDTQPKTTQQLLDDANVDIEGWLAAKVADKFARFENAEFITGATGKIKGLISGVTPASDSGSGVTWGTVGYYPTGTSGAFASTNPGDNLINLVGLLKNAYLPNARWITRRSVITLVRKFKDGMGQYLWQPGLQAGEPERILGYPVSRMEDVPTVAANSYSMAFGDFRAAYQIVDRTGIRVLRDPYTSKPYVIFYTTKRTGGGVVNYEAYKLLKFGTS